MFNVRSSNLIKSLCYVLYIVISVSVGIELITSIFPFLFPLNMRVLFSTGTQNKINSKIILCEDTTFCKRAPFSKMGGIFGGIEHDEIGFYNDKYLYTNSRTLPIIAIGDSYTHGHGEELSYPKALAHYSGLSVLNLGIPGASPQMAREALLRYGIKKNPNLVIFGLYTGNDAIDIITYDQKIKKDQPFLSNSFIEPPKLDFLVVSDYIKLKNLGLYHSNVFSIFYHLRNKFKRSNIPKKEHMQWKAKIQTRTKTFITFWNEGYPGAELTEDRTYSLLKEELIKMKIATNQVGGKLLVIIFPNPNSFYNSYIDENFEHKGMFESAFSQGEYCVKKMDTICKDIGVECIDILPLLKQRFEDSQELYFDTGVHLSAAGNDAVGAIINQHINRSESLKYLLK